jgi:large subunit ribosomal protein L15e
MAPTEWVIGFSRLLPIVACVIYLINAIIENFYKHPFFPEENRRCRTSNPESKGETKMGMYKYIKEAWKKPKENMPDLMSERLIAWRQEPVTVRLEHPTRLDKARALGYKAIQGVFIVRQRVDRGGRMRPTIRKARRPKTSRQKKIVSLNYQTIAEARAGKKYPNCEVLNSYWVGDDGKYKWYEVIIVDPMHPEVQSRDYLKWMLNPANTNRVSRGLTSAARKGRGLIASGKGTEKHRPSLRSHHRTH